MNRLSLLVLGVLLFSVACFGQANAGDSQTLQALLAEVRLLRQDLRTTTVAAQRSQILMSRIQTEEAAIRRATQHLDEARERLAKSQDERKILVASIKQNEDFANNAENSAAQRKSVENVLAEFRGRLEVLEIEEQQRQSTEVEARQQLRAEEARLNDFHNQLDRLDKSLEGVGGRVDGSRQ